MHGTVCIGDAIDWSSPLNRGLVSWWLALPDQQRGVMFRDLCMRNHGTLTNGPLWQGAMGRPGGWGSLVFDGSDDFIQCASGPPPNSHTDGHWCSAWIRYDSAPDGLWAGIFDATNGATAGTGVVVRGSDQTIGLFYNGGNSVTYSTGSLTDAVWTKVDVTWNAADTKARFYLSGKLDTTTSAIATTWSASSTAIDIGRFVDFYRLAGSLDCLRIYNLCPSDARVAATFAEDISGYPTTLNWTRPRVAVEQGGGAAFIDNNNPIWRHILAGVL